MNRVNTSYNVPTGTSLEREDLFVVGSLKSQRVDSTTDAGSYSQTRFVLDGPSRRERDRRGRTRVRVNTRKRERVCVYPQSKGRCKSRAKLSLRFNPSSRRSVRAKSDPLFFTLSDLQRSLSSFSFVPDPNLTPPFTWSRVPFCYFRGGGSRIFIWWVSRLGSHREFRRKEVVPLGRAVIEVDLSHTTPRRALRDL